MREQWAVQNLLREQLERARARNGAYSIRSFARRLNMSSAAVSEILNGKRRVSIKGARKIADRLALDPKATRELLEGFASAPRRSSQARKPPPAPPRRPLELEADQFRAISEWPHFAILSLSETEGFQTDPAWIAARLGINPSVAVDALARLERLGLYPAGDTQYTTSDEVLNGSVRRSHLEDLELIRRAIEERPIHQRDSTSITIAMDPAQLPLAKKRIREFRDALCQELERGRKRAVAKLCIHFVPLTEPFE